MLDEREKNCSLLQQKLLITSGQLVSERELATSGCLISLEGAGEGEVVFLNPLDLISPKSRVFLIL